MCDAIVATMRALMDQGDYSKAATVGENLAIENHTVALSPAYFTLLAAAHLGAGFSAAARLTVVRGVAESSDKSLDFLSRLLLARHEGRYADAVNALKSAPQDVAEVFRDILVCEVAYTTASTYTGAHLKRVCDLTSLSADEAASCLKRKGKHFGVEVSAEGGALKRVLGGGSSSNGEEKKKGDGAATTGIAPVELITQAALMTAQPVDRYWKGQN